MLRFAPFALLVLLAAPVAAFAAQESDHEIHEELRGILQTLQASINSGNFDAMLPVISKDVRATTITQEVLSSHSNVSSYFNKWFGPGGYLKKLEMKLDADALTELSPEKTWGLVRGSGLENYTLSDGRFYPMKTRWTAVVAKEDDGKWRLRAIHIGTNFLDNPILSEAEAAAKKYTAFGIAGGVVVGVGLGFLFGRRKK